MTTSTITLNPGTGGDKPLVDTLTTVNGATAPAGAVAQMVKVGFGAASDFKTVTPADPMPVAGVDLTAVGTLAAALQTVAISAAGGISSVSVQITGTWVGTIQFEGVVNGVDWEPINGVYAGTSQPARTITANGIVRLTPASLASVRVNMIAFTSGTANISMRASSGAGGIFANQILPVKTLENGFISLVNSTSAALAANATFLGAWEETTEFGDIRVTGFADQASAIDGLQIQQSSNGVNADLSDNYTLPASTGRPFSVSASLKFYRIGYTNGATAQTVMRLQAKLYKGYTKGSSVRPQDGRSRENDMEEVLSYLMAFNGTSMDMLRSTIANGLAVDVTRLPALPAGANTIGNVLMTPVTSLTVLSAANTISTLTLPAAAAGLFHYITRLRITLHNTSAAAVVGSAAALAFTSANLPGALAWTDGNAIAAGTSKEVADDQLENPLKSSVAATNTTISAPAAGAGVQSRITAYYYIGP